MSEPVAPPIPRHVLYGNPERADVQISPDGEYLSWLAPDGGVLNVWVAPADDLAAARVITTDRRRGIRSHDWAFTGRHVLFPQDVGGDENFHVYAVDVQTGEQRDLTPFENVTAMVAARSREVPGSVLVQVNDRVPQLHDVLRVDIATGEWERLVENPGFAEMMARDDFTVPLAAAMREDGGVTLFRAVGDGYEPLLEVDMADSLTTGAVGFPTDKEHFYLLDSRGRDKAALYRASLSDGSTELVFESDAADVSAILTHPVDKTVQAVEVEHARTEWVALDDSVAADLARLGEVAPGDLKVLSRTDDDRTWMVAFLQDAGPVRYYRYDRDTGAAEFLFLNRSDLEGYTLTPMHPVVIPARDGLDLVSYLSLPAWTDPEATGRPTQPLPLVLDVHGGPWARDSWGFNPEHQLLADRGYAVLSVNYRGSTGFGKAFLNAGDKQWARAMHDDLLDAVAWAVAEGVADPARIAIHGGSYGGYATLVGLTMTPDVFACGVDIVGPSNLITLLESIPPYWAPMLQVFKDRVGDPTTDEGRELLTSRSPLTYVDQIRRPLLIGQGANDPRVKQAEAEQIVSAMNAHGIPVTYVLFPDEGHGFAEPANRLSFFAVTEAFLAEHLGGRAQPFDDVFAGSSITVPAGSDGIPGLGDRLPG
ncbi:MAG: S9 family peptidase [Candidatus Nanopelagicales bacterium]